MADRAIAGEQRPGPVDDAVRRARNVEDVNAQLYELYDVGCLAHFSHSAEPARNVAGATVDVWHLTFPDKQERSMPYSQVRSFLRGVHLGWRYPRTPPA